MNTEQTNSKFPTGTKVYYVDKAGQKVFGTVTNKPTSPEQAEHYPPRTTVWAEWTWPRYVAGPDLDQEQVDKVNCVAEEIGLFQPHNNKMQNERVFIVTEDTLP